MSALAEDSLETTSAKTWLMRIVIGVVVIALIAGLTLMLKKMLSSPTAAKRQVAKISILPDTPPPPPPPPKEEKKLEPVKEQVKQEVREQPVKQDVPKPADAPIKMDGPAGDGPSAFAAGNVTSEYKGGAPVVGSNSTGSVSVSNAVDRTQERF